MAEVPSAAVPLAIVCVTVADADGKVIVVPSVPAIVSVLFIVRVLPPVTFTVPVEAVMFNPFMLVWEARAAGRSPEVIALNEGVAVAPDELPHHLWAAAVPRVNVTAPVEDVLVISAPSPLTELTPLDIELHPQAWVLVL